MMYPSASRTSSCSVHEIIVNTAVSKLLFDKGYLRISLSPSICHRLPRISSGASSFRFTPHVPSAWYISNFLGPSQHPTIFSEEMGCSLAEALLPTKRDISIIPSIRRKM